VQIGGPTKESRYGGSEVFLKEVNLLHSLYSPDSHTATPDEESKEEKRTKRGDDNSKRVFDKFYMDKKDNYLASIKGGKLLKIYL